MSPSSPDPQTQQAYASAAPPAGWGSLSESFRTWIRALPAGSRCLDVGCGNGLAVAEMMEHGHNAMGVDASPEMVAAARKTVKAKSPDSGRIQQAALPGELGFADASFDAVSCCAVLMHLPSLQLFDALQELKRLLRVGGRLFLSIPKSRPDVDPDTHRDSQGRLFTPIQTHQLSLLCERMGLRLDQQTEEADSLGREGIVWSNLGFTKQQIP